MKIKFLLSFLTIMMISTTAFASFPVVKTASQNETTVIETVDDQPELESPAAAKDGPNMWVGVALWFFLGWPFAAHRWYYKKPTGVNILFILTIGGLGIWWIIDLINILTDNF